MTHPAPSMLLSVNPVPLIRIRDVDGPMTTANATQDGLFVEVRSRSELARDTLVACHEHRDEIVPNRTVTCR